MSACLTSESLLLTVLSVFNSQLAYCYISRLKENTTQAAGIIILIKKPHECWSESPHRTDALQAQMGFQWSLENPLGFCGQPALSLFLFQTSCFSAWLRSHQPCVPMRTHRISSCMQVHLCSSGNERQTRLKTHCYENNLRNSLSVGTF